MTHYDTDWMDDAACNGQPTKWWFPDEGPGRGTATNYARARVVCAGCPVREACDNYANHTLTYAEAGEGMWAGRTPRERRRERRALSPARGNYGRGQCPYCAARFIKRHAQAVLCGDLACEKASMAAARARHDAKRRAS
jgi:hypothetical protein